MLNIKQWSPEDRPREKMLLKGASALSDAELIGILIGSGSAELSAVELGRHILQSSKNNLHELGRLSISDLMKFKGIGEAKAITILAALELGRRRRESDSDQKPKIVSSADAYQLIREHLIDLSHEEFWVMLLNRANQVTRKYQISQGGVAGTVADPKIVFKTALDGLASGIIVAHNHPSGNLSPSHADIELTKKLREAGKLLEIQVLDHLIVAGSKYYSFADEGLI